MRPADKHLVIIWSAIAFLLTQSIQLLHAQSVSSPAITAFSRWAERYAAQTNRQARLSMVAEGVSAARERRALLKSLIKSDPQTALALSRSQPNAADLPPEIQREQETPFTTHGDFIVQGV